MLTDTALIYRRPVLAELALQRHVIDRDLDTDDGANHARHVVERSVVNSPR